MNPCHEKVGVISFFWSNMGAFSERFHVLKRKVEKGFFMGLDMIK